MVSRRCASRGPSRDVAKLGRPSRVRCVRPRRVSVAGFATHHGPRSRVVLPWIEVGFAMLRPRSFAPRRPDRGTSPRALASRRARGTFGACRRFVSICAPSPSRSRSPAASSGSSPTRGCSPCSRTKASFPPGSRARARARWSPAAGRRGSTRRRSPTVSSRCGARSSGIPRPGSGSYAVAASARCSTRRCRTPASTRAARRSIE